MRAADGTALRVTLDGRLEAVAEAELRLTCGQLRLEALPDAADDAVAAAVAAVEAALNFPFTKADTGEWVADPTTSEPLLSCIWLTQLYLDQDLHVLRYRFTEDATTDTAEKDRKENLAVLFKASGTPHE